MLYIEAKCKQLNEPYISILYSFMPRFDLRFRTRVDWVVAGDRNSDALLMCREVALLAKREMYAICWGEDSNQVGGQ